MRWVRIPPSNALRAVRAAVERGTSRSKLWLCASVGRQPRVLGRVWIHGKGAVRLGDRVVLDGRACPIELHTFENGEILIGSDVHIEAGTSIEAWQRVQIGDRCHIGCYCKIIDNNLHPIQGDRHKTPESRPVILEEDVCVGPFNVLLPGAHLERGVVLDPGKVTGRRIAAPRRNKD